MTVVKKDLGGSGTGVVALFSCFRGCFSSSLCIVNDHLFVRDARPDEIQSAFSIPVATPCSSSTSTLSQEHQRMAHAFSIQSGMKLQWAQK